MELLKTLQTLRLLKNNPKLLNIYANPFDINKLYMLSKNNYDDKNIQQVYNKLDNKYKYHSIVFYGIPMSYLLVKPSIIKNINLSKILFFWK